ncbi:MAG: tRNA dihydrouridine(20/20a) synthase DusA [Pseudomonadales bacterium]|nr:tRNA dihydrouridine(20/20a) synthase DusA [Pseudomonadales bacterium]
MPDHKLCVAPMMGCTDRHCRYLFRLLSPNAMLYSEMVVTGALVYGDAPAFLQHADDEPCSFQLGGSDPEQLAAAAKLIEQAGYQEVNLNCGCPSDRVQVGGIGACLMADPELVTQCYEAMSDAVSIPVTIKSRIGIDDHNDYAFFAGFISPLYAAGCRTFIVHARNAILQGLSPKENREIPPLKYEYVYRAMEEFSEANFVLNGGLKTVDDIAAYHTQVNGLMLGRAVYANPFLLAKIDQQLFSSTLPNELEVLSTYREYMMTQISKGEAFKHMAKHLLGYFTGYRGARHFRRHLSSYMFQEDAGISVLDDALSESKVTNNFMNQAES